MSIKSWRKEFFPSYPPSGMTLVEAAEHSLQKWRGMLEENLKKHKVTYDEAEAICALGTIASCALCSYQTEQHKTLVPNCSGCPLKEIMGASCRDDSGDEEETSYQLWATLADEDDLADKYTRNVVNDLELALELAKEREKKR